MRILLSGIAGAIVLGLIAAIALRAVQDPAYQVYSSTSTRLGDPGSNLVGGAWPGNKHEGGTTSGSAGADAGTARTTR